jgi:hypothetical protein
MRRNHTCYGIAPRLFRLTIEMVAELPFLQSVMRAWSEARSKRRRRAECR